MNRQDWFTGKRWGMFTHYLPVPAGDETGDFCSAEDWNRRIDAFDTELLAKHLHEVGADYFCITIGQNSGHYNAPNAVYDELTGIVPSKCARRDLIHDIAVSLEPYGIDLQAYLPSGAPEHDLEAVEKLEWVNNDKLAPNKHQRLISFQKKWEAVIREWSLRWGKKVKGWWFDGCYYPEDMYLFSDEPNFTSFAAAARAGNPDAAIGFNRGLETPFLIQSQSDDYTSGEVGEQLPIPSQEDLDNLHGKKLHILSYLGKTWSAGQPRFPDELVIGYSKLILAKGGVITWDAPLERNGGIPEAYRRQMKALNEALK